MTKNKTIRNSGVLLIAATLAACGGGGGDGGTRDTTTGSKPPAIAGPDSQAPLLVITDPGDFSSITVGERTIDLSGVAQDNRRVSGVRWSTNHGDSGDANGTTNWSVDNLPLPDGKTTVTLVAEDSDGNRTSRFLQISYDPVAVADNTPPVLSGSPPKTAFVQQPWNFFPTASDADSDDLEFTAQNLPAWLRLDPTSGHLEGTPSREDVGEARDITLSVSDGIAVTELAPFSITVTDAERAGEPWLPSVPADALVIVEVDNHQAPVALPRSDLRLEAGGVVGSTSHTKNGRDQVLLHSWPLQILIAAGGELAVADLQRNTRYVHPSPLDSEAPSGFAVRCESDRWTVSVDGNEEVVPAAKAPPVCIAATWGKVTIGAADAQGTAAAASPFDLVWYGVDQTAGGSGNPEPVLPPDPDPDPEPGPEPEPNPGDRTVFLSLADIVTPEAHRRESSWEAPEGSGGIQISYTPGDIARSVTLVDSWPLNLRIVPEGEVILTWAKSGQFQELRVPAAATVGRPMNIHWRCGDEGWSLEADGATGVRQGASMPCVDDPWGNPVHVGIDRGGNNALAGRLSLDWYADGIVADGGEPDPEDPPPPADPPPADDPPAPAPEGVAFVGDFETGDVSQWPAIGNPDSIAYGVVASEAESRNGRFAGRMEVRYMDRGLDENGNPNKVRAEAFEKPVKVGSEWWYGWSAKIDPSWRDQDNTWYIIQQFHQHGEGTPPLMQSYSGGFWSIRCLASICGDDFILWQKEIPKGQWIDWIYQVKWSSGDDGFVRVWMNNELVLDHRGPNAHDSKSGPYFKFGIYRGGRDQETQVMWNDEYRRGTSKAAVDPSNY